MSIGEMYRNILNSLLDGSFERMRLIGQINANFKEKFAYGDLNRWCRASISWGNSQYAHEMSSLWFRSGLRIRVENDKTLKEPEINELAQHIMKNGPLVRQLMALGFDTLIVKGKSRGLSKDYALKDYAKCL